MLASREQPHPPLAPDPDQFSFLTFGADSSVSKIGRGLADGIIWLIFKLDFWLNAFSSFRGDFLGDPLLSPFRRLPPLIRDNPLPLSLVGKLHAYSV